MTAFPAPWKPIAEAKKDGRLLILLVDYSEETNAAEIAEQSDGGYLWSGNALEDELVARTVGHNSFENTGDDRWEFAGWCWSQDHYTEGHGAPIAFIEMDAVAPLPGGGCVMEAQILAAMESSGLPEHVVRAAFEARP